MAHDGSYLTLTPENFEREVLESTEPVVVDFWAEWCGPCHMIAPTLEALAAEFRGTAKVGKVNVDEHGALAARFGIQSIPTLLFFHGGQVADRSVGVVPKAVLAGKLQALLATA